MATCLFAWNPALWNWPELAADIARLRRRGHLDTEWSCGRARHVEPGSRAFLIRLGVPPKGIFGAGVTMTEPEQRLHWLEAKAAAGVQTNYVMLRLESLLIEPLIRLEELQVPPYGRYRWAVRQSGTRVPSSLAAMLEDLWDTRLLALASAAKAAPSGSVKRRAKSRA